MNSWTQPTAEELDRAAALAARSENRAYFFERLNNPLWVEPLAERGFFGSPPSPVDAPEPGYVRFPPWPEGRYLARMASSAPEAVASVLSTIDRSANPAVTRLLLEAVTTLPHGEAVGLIERILDWVSGPHADFFSDDAVAVVLHLIDADEVSSAIDIASSLLRVGPDPRLAEKASSADSPYRLTPEASARISDWEYERVIEQLLRALVAEAELDAIGMFSRLLDDALRLSRWEDEVPDEAIGDSSYIWRSAIEDHPQNLERGAKNVLVTAVRDAALAYASQGASETEDTVRFLDQGSTVHRRIALHVLANTDLCVELAADHIADRGNFDDHRVRHEYAELLRGRLQDVGESAQHQVIEWIEAGPDLEAYRKRRTEWDGSEPSDEEVQKYADIWRRDRYSYIPDSIERQADRYRELVETYGEPEHPDLVSWSTSWVGPESPIQTEELVEMSPSQAAGYLRTWHPEDDSGWHFGPSIEGLGRVFSGAVAARPEDYATEADRFIDLDPTYIRDLLSGLEKALTQGSTFSWEAPIRLALWVAQQPFEPDVEASHHDRDPGFRWARRQVSSLLRSGLADKENGIPPDLRGRVWEIIERLIEDPNPSPEHEARYGGDNMDPLTLSLNTNRGEAMHAAIQYALWVHRDIERRGEDISPGLDLIPEFRSLLEHRLDLTVEPSHAVRAVIGRWLPWLVLMDEEWAIANLDLVFPGEPNEIAYADTAWSTYISWCSPYHSTFRALRSQYEEAIRRVPSDRKGGSLGRESVDAKLGEHIVTFYWRGDGDRELLEQFFERADDELAAAVLDFIGRALRNTSGDLSAPIKSRLEEFFEWRLEVAESAPDEHKGEARAFGTWFSSGKLDEAWALETLRKTIDLAGAPTFGDAIVRRLVDIAHHHPAAAVDAVASMLEGAEHEWDHVAWREPVERLLSVARESGAEEAEEGIRRIVDHYVTRGRNEFRTHAPRV